MKLDIQKLKKALRDTAGDIKKLKTEMRQSGYNPSAKEYRQLGLLKYEATRLCSIRAHGRGRVHMKGSTLEDQADYIGEGWKTFEVPAAEEAGEAA